MRIALFYHSLESDWNHGNAHFLRGIAGDLKARGHEVLIFEPEDSWSRNNLLEECGTKALQEFHDAFPELTSQRYNVEALELGELLDGVELILAHEWNEPRLIKALGEYRRRNSSVRLFFHDTHHRALSAQHELSRFDLSDYDGVLAYGESLKQAYEGFGWGRSVHVWHEAADTRIFYPRHRTQLDGDVIWIGNWGDDERTQELRDYFIKPVQRLTLQASVFGVRYPSHALEELRFAHIAYRGWIANFKVPSLFARFRATVHVPRRFYTQQLPGIPTIRPFEALACGIPLISAPWQDCEGLFRVNEDFLMARNPEHMEMHLVAVLNDQALADSLVSKGLETIRDRHTCTHRVDELLAIYGAQQPASLSEPAGAAVS